MKAELPLKYDDIISAENLLTAWKEFLRGKRQATDVQAFSLHLMDSILQLHDDLANRTYRHSGYESFYITDPKPRHIHKASVQDRLLHHAVYRKLYPFFDRTFIADSYSCRVNKGGHKALQRFKSMAGSVGKNNTRTCWVLQCDIRKFFANIDQNILNGILRQYIPDKDILALLENIIASFHTQLGKGLPLGNLTSQLLVNIYMNEFDQFVKHRLKAKYYIRYADDFVFLSNDRAWLKDQIPLIEQFLNDKLALLLHPDKIHIKTLASGVDFLGWQHYPYHRTLRTTTKHRMIRRIKEHSTAETLQSYLGLLSHGNTHKIQEDALNEYWIWQQ
ncbi:MAG: group II intron reverse transcriptase domain-containing protein [Candidatus Kerfeldbacteria bacterium]|nr:group II intron reverse transcriptase domain-containing protein [Candidatus Kerfeldbacteria bacterium]